MTLGTAESVAAGYEKASQVSFYFEEFLFFRVVDRRRFLFKVRHRCNL
jgi:hypothetical protein